MSELKISGSFEDTKTFQEKYDSLLKVCQTEGTMIYQGRSIKKFIGKTTRLSYMSGTREYVFPQQTVSLYYDSPQVIAPSPRVALISENQRFDFDEDLIGGKIRIAYKDDDRTPVLEVTDLLEASEIPDGVRRTLETIFEITDPNLHSSSA